MGANDPRYVANLDPKGMIGRIYDWTTKHCYKLNIQDSGFVVSEKKIFYVFPIMSLWQIMTTHRRGQFGPQGHGWQDL